MIYLLILEIYKKQHSGLQNLFTYFANCKSTNLSFVEKENAFQLLNNYIVVIIILIILYKLATVSKSIEMLDFDIWFIEVINDV